MNTQIVILTDASNQPFQLIASLLAEGVNVRVHKVHGSNIDHQLGQEIRMAINASPKIIWLDSEPKGAQSIEAVTEAMLNDILVLQIHSSNVFDLVVEE